MKHVVVIGGGIVGLSTALVLSERFPKYKITVIEKEAELALHQTGRNSGVLHAAPYYKPGSNKALLCREGLALMKSFCSEHQIAHEICGKVIVAKEESEYQALQGLYENAQLNGVSCELIEEKQLRQREPYVRGKKAILVHETGIVDYKEVCEKIAGILESRGVEIALGALVKSFQDSAKGTVITSSKNDHYADIFVNCSGLFSDRLAKKAGAEANTSIVPFRGEYFELRESARKLCNHLIYPVPNPDYPFLGVHFTRMIGGEVECGPNAVLAFAREGYRLFDINLGDSFEVLTSRSFWSFAKDHFSMGVSEMYRSLFKSAFVKELQKLIPDVRSADLIRAPAGVRAQAMGEGGELIKDFSIVAQNSGIHVLNAPSPAATSSLAIGNYIVKNYLS